MKKVLKILLIIIALVGVLFVLFLILTKPTGDIEGIDLVPKDAIVIIETDKPYGVWNEVINNTAWAMLQKNEYLSGIDSSFKSLDSLVSENKLLYKLIGNRTVLASIHQISKGEFESFFIVDLKALSRFSNINSRIISLLGSDYEVTTRNYKNNEIVEVFDKEEAEYIYISFIENKMVIAYYDKLIESSIDQYREPYISADDNFIVVQEKVRKNKMLRIYVNYSELKKFKSESQKQNDFLAMLSTCLNYSALSFNLAKEGRVVIEGNTSIDTAMSYIRALHISGTGSVKSFEIAPSRTAFLSVFSFKEFETFYANLNKSMQTDEDKYEELQNTIGKIERNFEINLEENFFGWIDNEIAVMQIQPENIESKAQYAVVLKAKSRRLAEKNLDFIVKQIKRNTPGLKFKDIDYKDHTIYYLSIPKFFKLIFGKLIKDIEKPYFTIINDYVVFSNHPQILKSIIQNYIDKNTLENNKDFLNFSRQFSKTSNIMVYINTPLFFNNSKSYVDLKTWEKLQKNKDYIICYPHIGFQLEGKEGDVSYSKIVLDYNPEYELPEEAEVKIDSIDNGNINASEIYISDLDAEVYKEYYSNGDLKFSVDIEKGQKHGAFKEYYSNGDIKVKGKFKNDKRDGVWKYYKENKNLFKEEEYDDGKLISQ